MPLIEFTKNRFVLAQAQNIEDSYQNFISGKLIEKYGYGTFENTNKVFEILMFIYQLYSSEFKRLIENENRYSFYEQLFVLLEDTIYNNDDDENRIKNFINSKIPSFDIGLYRRSLMLILENSVTLELIFDKHLKTPDYIEDYYAKAEVLIFVAIRLYKISFDMSLFKLMNDSYKITLDKSRGYKAEPKSKRLNRELKVITEDIIKQQKQIRKYDNDRHTNHFDYVLKDVFGIKSINILEHAAIVKNESNYDIQTSLATLFVYEKYIEYLCNNYTISKAQATKLLNGLIITKGNKKSFDKIIRNPNINERLLYRPFLEVKFNDRPEKEILSGFNMINYAIDMLAINSFTWKVYPIEWKNEQLTKNLNKIENKRSKELENRFEKMFDQKEILFVRNVKDLFDKNGNKHTIEHEDCGEIDFIFLFKSKLFVADSKCLRVYADSNGYRIVKDKFTTKSKSGYNNKLIKKIKYLNQNRNLLRYTFEYKYPKDLDKVNFDKIDFEGIFLINYPTFYMYYSYFKMYTSYSFEKFLNGEDPFPK